MYPPPPLFTEQEAGNVLSAYQQWIGSGYRIQNQDIQDTSYRTRVYRILATEPGYTGYTSYRTRVYRILAPEPGYTGYKVQNQGI